MNVNHAFKAKLVTFRVRIIKKVGKLSLPIVSSPMDTVTGVKMASVLGFWGRPPAHTRALQHAGHAIDTRACARARADHAINMRARARATL